MAVRNWERFWARLAMELTRAQQDACTSHVDDERLSDAYHVAVEMERHHREMRLHPDDEPDAPPATPTPGEGG